MLKDEVTIIFCTCDEFSDLWEGFFKLLKKYWPTCECEIILNTESKSFNYEGLNISAPLYCAPGTAWSERLKLSLEKAKTDQVLIFLDDFYLKSPVNEEVLYSCVENMKINSNNKSFIFAWQPGRNKLSNINNFEKRGRFSTYRINAQIGLWNKNYLKDILRDNESAWEFEVNGSFRSFFKKGDLYSLKKDAPLVFDYDFGFLVIRGKFNMERVHYFSEVENITFNTKKRVSYINKLQEVSPTLKTRVKQSIRKLNYLIQAIKSI